jgi:tRNA(fMet)-specific endonuclease VapC
MLDTNIVIHARDGTESVLSKLVEHDGSVLLSALVLAELQRGIYKNSLEATLRRTRLEPLLRSIPIIPFDTAAAEAYGRIIAQGGWVRVRDFDRMIAAHALATNSILVTNNAADFRDIPELAIENWALDI